MDDSRKKGGRAAKGTPDETWVELLGGSKTEAPSGVTIYTGLLRKKPDHEGVYQLYRSLDMRVVPRDPERGRRPLGGSAA